MDNLLSKVLFRNRTHINLKIVQTKEELGLCVTLTLNN
jgi:hypothetical protein